MDDAKRRPPRHRFLRAAGGGALVAGAWLLFAGTVQRQDLTVAIVVGIGATVLGAALRRRLGHHPAGAGRWVRLVPAVALGVVRDSWTLARSLPALRRRPPFGRVVEVPFAVGDDDDDDAAARRVVATVTSTMQPNTILLGFDRQRSVALLHVLVDTGRPLIEARLVERTAET